MNDNFQTFSDVYGAQRRHWNGVEVNFTARVRGGLTFQGGTSTGRRIDDTCELREVLPEIALLNPNCPAGAAVPHRFQGARLVHHPVVDVQVSGTFQSLPGDELAANYNVPSATVALSLGRPLSGNAQFANINLLSPGEVIGDRINQLDFRVSKILRFGRTGRRLPSTCTMR